MTLAEIRTAVRSLSKESETDDETIFPADNVLLDFFINMACELVVIDLAEFMPEVFLNYEDISLEASEPEYTLTAEWMRVWAMMKNVTNENPTIIPYIDIQSLQSRMYTGETAADPEAWTLKGDTVIFVPTPSTAKTEYARFWYIATEAATMAAGGPAIIPRMAHKLIPLMACIVFSAADGADTKRWENIYAYALPKIRDMYQFRVQQQPRFIGGSFLDKANADTRDRALYDKSGFFR